MRCSTLLCLAGNSVRYTWRLIFGVPVAKRKAKVPDEVRWERAAIAVLKATREDADVPRRMLEEKLGWDGGQVKNFEIGRRALSLVDFIRLARALGMEPDALLRRIMRWRMS